MMRFIVLISLIIFSSASFSSFPPESTHSKNIRQKNLPVLNKVLAAKGASIGNDVFVRIFKKESLLEVWIKNNDGRYVLLKNYNICHYSGRLGPKIKEGDRQAPEGFYYTNAARMNPWSQWGLSFNIGYPNTYDRAHSRIGSYIMVHGYCYSVGCFAMRNKNIYEIYPLIEMALRKGQPLVRVHIFPFKMTAKNMHVYRKHHWYAFWRNLKQGYDHFEKYGQPPNVEVKNKYYFFNSI